MTSRRKPIALAVATAAVCSAIVLAGCGSGSQGDATSTGAVTTKMDPANFGDPATGANPYLPLAVGTQWVREGTTEVGGRAVPHQVTTTVTDVFREVAGVRTVVLFDFETDGGQISQVSLDYVAEDKEGNVWLFGGYTEEYEGGQFIAAVDPWMAGVNGAKAGILVQGDPKVGSPPYAVAQPDAEEGDVAEVIAVGAKRCVPFKCFDDTLIVREGKASAPDNEFKYYARDVGQIDNVPRGASVHQDVERLVNLTTLSKKALAETSGEVLGLDHRAPAQAKDIFGGRPVGTRQAS